MAVHALLGSAAMSEKRRKILVVADDRDVAEVAAFGLRMYDGWESIVATSPAQALKAVQGECIVGIANIVVQPSTKVPQAISKLLSLSTAFAVPLFGISPDPTICKQFALLGVNAFCTPFDPIHMWSQLPQSVAGFTIEADPAVESHG